ncbi:MAG: hypothetical protein EON59_10710 [Alphaproteobacteria bacterium]|nr:MAG: hypothetical protein EON59_10710 [Alphaproteobacteria bacterium]
MSEATYTHSRLFPEGSSAQDWQGIIDPFEIVGAQQPPIGSNITMARDLSNAEQNLLMSLKEEEFLMSMSEAFARHETVRDGIAEYKMRHAAITERAPAPEATNGEVATFMLTNQQKNELWPYVMPAASLLTSLRDLSAINLKELQLMGVAFHPMMRRHYPGLHIHKIETIEAD